ncbi:MAG: bifunctional glutamate N-acetyltransferase/amino-acid acetyltransferase ArgJ [Pirellulales bacterium]
MAFCIPRGFRAAGVHCGLKRNPNKPDVALIVSDRPSTAAGVYTQNVVCAAPVRLDRQRTPSDSIRAVVVNSGNANACTGEQGDRDALQMAEWAAQACGADGSQVLVLSTGIIGELLPMDRIQRGIEAASSRLGSDEETFETAARGLLTTDSTHKIASDEVPLDAGPVRILGIAKGAAMIGPNMATMLAVILTDAVIDPQTAQQLLATATDDTFNCISVEGHVSTNDSVVLLANGASGTDVSAGREKDLFTTGLCHVCEDLARAIPSDGEGATHLITIEIHGCANRENARRIAKTVANSPLVKTAIAGADPNWGRIVSAAGYAGVQFDPMMVSLHVNGLLLYERGVPVPFDGAKVSQSIRDHRDTSIVLLFSEGSSSARFWTSDLTAEYVRLNADYHT